jgi:4-methyl-5(b-hydroxyethyl)-thiazole monophosphate biosynthesis
MIKNIAVHLAEGFEEIEAISIIDVLRRADFNVSVISVTGKNEVTSKQNVTVAADQLFENVDYEKIDMIVLPGGMPGAKNLKEHKALGEKILSFYKSGKPLGAICAAPIVFGNLGILENKNATCFPGFEDELKGANLTGNDVEVDGKIITGKGAGVAILFALKIVEFIKGKESADELGKRMVVPQFS